MKNIFFRFHVFGLVFFLLGCQSLGLPSEKQDLSEFVPKLETIIEFEGGEFDFRDEFFPSSCDWKMLDRVIDGDTILLENNEKVRFVGIDTPESKDERKPIQRGALKATAYTKEFFKKSKKVCLIYDEIGDREDIYKRTLAYIFTESGIDVNAELLKTGIARGLFYFPFSRKLEFESYLRKAKQNGVGLWKK